MCFFFFTKNFESKRYLCFVVNLSDDVDEFQRPNDIVINACIA